MVNQAGNIYTLKHIDKQLEYRLILQRLYIEKPLAQSMFFYSRHIHIKRHIKIGSKRASKKNVTRPHKRATIHVKFENKSLRR